MNFLYDIKIALFHTKKQIVRSNKRSLFFIIIMMTLLYVNLLFVSSLLLGIIQTLHDQFIDMKYANIVIEPENDKEYIMQVNEKQSLINSIPGVLGSSAHYKELGIFSFDKNKDGKGIKKGAWTIVSITPEDEANSTILEDTLVGGEYLTKDDRNKILLGREISGGYGANMENFSLQGADIGDEVKVFFDNGKFRKYIVKGIFSNRGEFTDNIAYITNKEMTSIIGQSDMAHEIIVKIENPGEEERYIEEFIDMGIRKEKIKPWHAFIGMITGMTDSFEIIKLIVYIIGLTVAGITIFIVIYISLLNKRKQIGILKAIGMRKGIIILSYIFYALFFALLGIGLGVFFVKFLLIPYFLKHPLDFPIGPIYLIVKEKDLLISSLCLIVVAILSGLIPSRQIIKQHILDAIYGRN